MKTLSAICLVAAFFSANSVFAGSIAESSDCVDLAAAAARSVAKFAVEEGLPLRADRRIVIKKITRSRATYRVTWQTDSSAVESIVQDVVLDIVEPGARGAGSCVFNSVKFVSVR